MPDPSGTLSIVIDGIEDAQHSTYDWRHPHRCEVGDVHFHELEGAPSVHYAAIACHDVTAQKDTHHLWLCGKSQHWHVSLVAASYCETGRFTLALGRGPHRKYEE